MSWVSSWTRKAIPKITPWNDNSAAQLYSKITPWGDTGGLGAKANSLITSGEFSQIDKPNTTPTRAAPQVNPMKADAAILASATLASKRRRTPMFSPWNTSGDKTKKPRLMTA